MTQKSCFVISPIGDLGSATRLRADQILKYVISPVLEGEWTIERADLIAEPGIITNQIIERLVNSDLVIADLSERNPNVFYELAVRHIARKPYVHLIAHDEDIPFDNAPVRAIKIDVTNLDSVDLAKQELKAQVDHAMRENAVVESPISVSLSLSEIRNSGDQEGVVLQSILSEIGSLRRYVVDSVARLQHETRTSAFLHSREGATNALGAYFLDTPPRSNSLFEAASQSATAAAGSATAATAQEAVQAALRGSTSSHAGPGKRKGARQF